MNLILTVIKDPDGANMIKHTKAFKREGGSFGRGDTNDWVLPDTARFLSSRHASIEYINKQYLLKDISTNGTYINNDEYPLGNSEPYTLQDGDIIRVGEYRLKASLREPSPNKNAVIPEGLGGAEFLDTGTHTKLNTTADNSAEARAHANELDKWLDDKAPASQPQDWGKVSVAQSNKESDPIQALTSNTESPATINNNDPLAVLSATAPSISQLANATTDFPPNSASATTDMSGNNQFELGSTPTSQAFLTDTHDNAVSSSRQKNENDPLAAFDQGNDHFPKQTAGWVDDEDWWKDGSQSDHAPADQHIMQPRAVSTRPSTTPEAQTLKAEHATAPVPTHQNSDTDFFQANTKENRFSSNENSLSATSNTQTTASENTLEEKPHKPHSPQSSSDNAHELANLLGLESLDSQQLNQLLPEAAGIINETVNRLIDLLRARSSLKNELRTDRTMISTIDNNPLKFSATATDALRTMFSQNSSAFLPPEQAINSSFNDLSDHQVAVLSGMRAAYDAMLQHFAPENLERFINANRGILSSKNAKNWEGYREYYKAMQRDQETTYNKLFGDEFAQTYEQQLSELENARALTNKK